MREGYHSEMTRGRSYYLPWVMKMLDHLLNQGLEKSANRIIQCIIADVQDAW